LLIVLCLAAYLAPTARAQDPKGHLLIIGGGDRTEQIMQRFVELAGGREKATIVVIPLASGDQKEAAERLEKEFKGLGVQNVASLLFSKEEALAGGVAERLQGATGVYFTGGDQIRVTRVILGTPVHKALLDLYRSGAVIGGTSAGAAIMSKVMITGEELINKDSTVSFVSIMKGNVETVEGLGFLDEVVIDQHFVKRKRLNRLISVVLEHPKLPGIGIDESTALIVSPGGKFEVLGEGTVVVFDARGARAIATDTHGNLAARNILTSIYRTGESFTLRSSSRP
jgi:cyanophycinase